MIGNTVNKITVFARAEENDLYFDPKECGGARTQNVPSVDVEMCAESRCDKAKLARG